MSRRWQYPAKAEPVFVEPAAPAAPDYFEAQHSQPHPVRKASFAALAAVAVLVEVVAPSTDWLVQQPGPQPAPVVQQPQAEVLQHTPLPSYDWWRSASVPRDPDPPRASALAASGETRSEPPLLLVNDVDWLLETNQLRNLDRYVQQPDSLVFVEDFAAIVGLPEIDWLRQQLDPIRPPRFVQQPDPFTVGEPAPLTDFDWLPETNRPRAPDRFVQQPDSLTFTETVPSIPIWIGQTIVGVGVLHQYQGRAEPVFVPLTDLDWLVETNRPRAPDRFVQQPVSLVFVEPLPVIDIDWLHQRPDPVRLLRFVLQLDALVVPLEPIVPPVDFIQNPDVQPVFLPFRFPFDEIIFIDFTVPLIPDGRVPFVFRVCQVLSQIIHPFQWQSAVVVSGFVSPGQPLPSPSGHTPPAVEDDCIVIGDIIHIRLPNPSGHVKTEGNEPWNL